MKTLEQENEDLKAFITVQQNEIARLRARLTEYHRTESNRIASTLNYLENKIDPPKINYVVQGAGARTEEIELFKVPIVPDMGAAVTHIMATTFPIIGYSVDCYREDTTDRINAAALQYLSKKLVDSDFVQAKIKENHVVFYLNAITLTP